MSSPAPRTVPHPPRRTGAPAPAPGPEVEAYRSLSGIALQPTRHDVLREAVGFAREASGAGGSFAACHGPGDGFPVEARVGLDASCWTGVVVRAGRGMGGRVLQERRLRTTDDYVRDPTITPDYVPIMRREAVHGTAVVPIADLSDAAAPGAAAGLLYVASHAVGAPGDRVLGELLRIADMAAVGLAHLADRSPTEVAAPVPSPLTPRETEVLRLLDAGCSNRQIAEELVVSASTVKAHLARLYRKLDAPSRLAAVAAGRRLGLV